ncbi:MAG: choice-of-anchor U domain-containing protein, partial [Lamprobacter sp.]|uniref:choice-of-anchor U domain-containing protein n=1 Tax=Lamprobacter sp. TaxID=3100796 RepID=UPI002B25AEFD
EPEPEPEPDAPPPEDEWADLPDNDGDGTPEQVEDFAPPLDENGTQGDGNGDGIPDREQTDVASIPVRVTDRISENPDATQVFISLIGGTDTNGGDAENPNTGPTPAGGVAIRAVSQSDAPPAQERAGITMPLGLIGFEAQVDLEEGAEDAGEVPFSLLIDGELPVNGFWKQTTEGDWVNLASDAYGGAASTVGTKTRLDFVITDNGPFDTNPDIGAITDPGAPGYRAEVDPDPDPELNFAEVAMHKLAGEVELSEPLLSIFARILNRQVTLDEEAGTVEYGAAFDNLLSVFTFVATDTGDRPDSPFEYGTRVAQAKEETQAAFFVDVNDALNFAETAMQRLAGEAELSEHLSSIFARILNRQVTLDEEAGTVEYGAAFDTLLSVFTFVATDTGDRPDSPFEYGARVEQAKEAAESYMQTDVQASVPDEAEGLALIGQPMPADLSTELLV